MKIVLHQQIDKPIREVFAVFTDFVNIKKNLSAVTRVEFLAGEGQPMVGMRWRETRTLLGIDTSEEMYISSIDAPHFYEVLAESHGTKYKTTFSFKAEGKKTKVIAKFEIYPQSMGAKLASFIGFLFMPVTKKSLRTDIADLKKVCEES